MPARDPITNTVKLVESNQRRRLNRALALQQGEISNLSFWVSQISMIVATVLGVYLAAQQGLQQAVTFEQIQSDKNNYYLRMSLQHELNDNLQLIQQYTEQIRGAGAHNIKRFALQLDTFVWDSMKYSPATLETPSVLLSGSRKFYRQVTDIHSKIENGTYHSGYGSKLLLEIVQQTQSDLMPKFQQDTATLKQQLAQRNIEVE